MTRSFAALVALAVSLSGSAFAADYSLVLTEAGANKIFVIKEVRAVTGLGLKEAKDLVEAPKPQVVKAGLSLDDANLFAEKFRAAGAKVEVRAADGKAEVLSVAAKPEPAARKSGWSVRLDSYGEAKIACIKVFKDSTGLGLAESKARVEAAPVVVKENLSKAEAEVLARQYVEVGGKAAAVAPAK